MDIPTESSFGVRTDTIYYNNGQVNTTETLIRKQSHSGSAAPIIKGDHVNPNNFSFLINDYVGLNGTITAQTSSYRQVLSGVLSNSPGISIQTADLDNVRNRAYAQALDSFYSQLEGMTDWASNAAEGGIKRSAQQVVQAADNVRRGAGRYGLKTIGKAWLHAQYVWKPLLNDIYNTVQAVTGTATRKGFKAEGVGYAEAGLPPTTVTVSGVTFRNVRVGGSIKHRCRIRGRFVVNPWLDLAAQLTSLDPLVIGWNALPYSFVVDWFINVGGYLGQLEAAARYKSAFTSKGGFVSRSTLIDAHLSHHGAAVQSGYTGSLSSSYTRKEMSRQTISGIPSPVRPSPNVKLGSGTMLNAAALLASKLSF